MFSWISHETMFHRQTVWRRGMCRILKTWQNGHCSYPWQEHILKTGSLIAIRQNRIKSNGTLYIGLMFPSWNDITRTIYSSMKELRRLDSSNRCLYSCIFKAARRDNLLVENTLIHLHKQLFTELLCKITKLLKHLCFILHAPDTLSQLNN